jgi:hypothetical protein
MVVGNLTDVIGKINKQKFDFFEKHYKLLL